MPRQPPLVKAGEPISARDYNALVQLAVANTPRAGHGLIATSSASGVVLALTGGGERSLLATITAVTGVSGDMVENVRYTAQAIGLPDAVITGATPDGGRVFAEGVACVPCAVGDPCLIVRVPPEDGGPPRAFLLVLTEKYMVRRCADTNPLNMNPEDLLRIAQGLPPINRPPPPPPGPSGPSTAPAPGGPSEGGGGGTGES